MYENFGAVVSEHAVEFKLFFPDTQRDQSQYVNGGLPGIKQVQVTGDFQSEIDGADWDFAQAPEMTKTDHPNGILYIFSINYLPDEFYQYKYFVTYEDGTTRWCGDPCAKYVATEHENAAFVIGGQNTDVEPIGESIPFQDLIIYELMIDDFTAGYREDMVPADEDVVPADTVMAPADAVKEKIDYLASLGINAIEFMPWTAWRGGEFS